MSRNVSNDDLEKPEFKLLGDEILIRDCYIIITYSFDLCIDIGKIGESFKKTLNAMSSTDFLKSYEKQSNRIFKDKFNMQFERFELPSADIRLKDSSKKNCFGITPILSIHKDTGVCILSLWVKILESQSISSLIYIRKKIDDLGSIEIKSSYILSNYINQLSNEGYINLNDYIGFISKNLGKAVNLNEYIYTSLLILDSSISDRLDSILSDSSGNDWEKRQLYGLITKNDIGRCMGLRKDEIMSSLDSEIDFRIGMASWFKEYSTIIIYSDISKKYVNYRLKQMGMTPVNRLLHTASLDVVIGEFLIFQIALISRFSGRITEILAICNKMSPRDLSEEWECIVRCSDYFYHASVLKQYVPGWGRYQEVKKNSSMDDLKTELFQSLSMLEKSIQSRYNDQISEKNLKVQYSLFALQIFVIFSVLNPLIKKSEDELYSFMLSIIIFILSIIIALALIYLIKIYCPKFDEFLGST